MAVIIVSTAWMADFRMTLVVGVPFLLVMALVFRQARLGESPARQPSARN